MTTLSLDNSFGDDMEKRNTLGFVPNVVVWLIALFLVSSLYQGLISSFSVNRVLGAALIIVLLFDYCKWMSHLRVLALVGFCFCFFISCLPGTSNLSNEFNDIMYLLAALLVIAYVSEFENLQELSASMKRHQSLLSVLSVFSGLTLVVLLVAKIGYVSSWGGSSYFIGLCNTEHTMAAVCCLIMVFCVYCGKQEALPSPVALLIILVATWALLQTGARTYLIPASIIWLYALKCLIKQKWLRRLLVVVLVFAVGLTFAASGMADKFAYTMSNQHASSPLDSLTSGRSEFWFADLEMYTASSPWNHVVGSSFSSVYDTNEAVFNMRIWSHNDFIMLLCSMGIIGLMIYIAALYSLFKVSSRFLTAGAVASLALYVLFPAFFNGFYINQHFVYSAIVLLVLLVENNQSYDVFLKNKQQRKCR